MCRAQVPDFISKADFDRVECVVHIVQHLRSPNRSTDDGSINGLKKQLGHDRAPPAQFADYNLAWRVNVYNATPALQQRRTHADTKIVAGLPIGVLLEEQNEPA